MHLQTHFLSGWAVGNLVPSFGARERFFCLLAAIAPDIDGLSLLGGWEYYHRYHHVYGHNLLFAVGISLLLAAFSKPRITAFAVYFGLLHLHFLMDLFGSGDGWDIPYLLPFSGRRFLTQYGWDFYSWQNLTAGALLIAATVAIVYWKKRTFLEFPMPRLDRQLVKWFMSIRQ